MVFDEKRFFQSSETVKLCADEKRLLLKFLVMILEQSWLQRIACINIFGFCYRDTLGWLIWLNRKRGISICLNCSEYRYTQTICQWAPFFCERSNWFNNKKVEHVCCCYLYLDDMNTFKSAVDMWESFFTTLIFTAGRNSCILLSLIVWAKSLFWWSTYSTSLVFNLK